MYFVFKTYNFENSNKLYNLLSYETRENNTAYNQFMGCYLFSDPEEERNLSLIYSCLQMSRRGFALDLAFDMQEGQQTVFLSPTS